MCILVRGEFDDLPWCGHRSVEILSFHRAPQRRVNILFLVLLQNGRPVRKDGLPVEDQAPKRDNYLHVLHPGRSACELTAAWIGDDFFGGLPYHPEEDRDSGSILNQIYGGMFEQKEDGIYQVQDLNPYESMYGLEEPRKVTIWPDEERTRWTPEETATGGIRPIEIPTERQGDDFIPFSVWRLGPFKSTGLVLASFAISFEGPTYDSLVGEREYFSVDGPRGLRCKTKYDCIRRMPVEEWDTWEQHLEAFDSHIEFKRSYDVIIRKNTQPDGSHVEMDEDGSCMVVEAGEDRQPHDRSWATRYITLDSDFLLNLHCVGDTGGTEPETPDVSTLRTDAV